MATLKTQEQFEKLRAKLKAGDYADRPELQAELISAAKEWKTGGQQRRDSRISDLMQANPGEYDPQSDEYREKYGPTQGFFSNLAAGAGKAVVDTGRGLQQLAVGGANLIPGVDLDETAAGLRSNMDDVRQRDDALMSTGAGLTGNIGANVAMFMMPGGLASGAGRGATLAKGLSNPQTYKAAAGVGALAGALNPVGSNESRALNTGLGAAGGLFGKAISQPLMNKLSRGGRSAKKLLEEAGVPLSIPQRTGSTAGQTVSGMLDDSIITANRQAAFKDTQGKAFTRAVLKTIGANGDEASEALMSRAKTKIGSVFNDIAKKTNGVKVDRQFMDEAAAVYSRAQKNLLDDEMRLFERNYVNALNGINNGKINASKFNAALSDFGGISGRPNIGNFAREMDDVFIDALARTSPSDAAALGVAKGQYRNMKIIQGAIGKGEERIISPLRLSGTLTTQTNQNLSVFGQGRHESKELAALARAGRELLPDFANSGTARRLGASTARLAAAGYAGNAIGGPVGGLLGAGAYAGGELGLQRALTSQGLLGKLIEQGLPGIAQPIVKQTAIQGTQQIQ